MSEENENDGTWSGLKKTIIGTLSTLVLGAGTWVGTTVFGGGAEEAQATQPAQSVPNIVLNVDNSSQNTNSGGGTTTIIKEKVVEAPAEKPKEKKKDEFAEEEPLW